MPTDFRSWSTKERVAGGAALALALLAGCRLLVPFQSDEAPDSGVDGNGGTSEAAVIDRGTDIEPPDLSADHVAPDAPAPCRSWGPFVDPGQPVEGVNGLNDDWRPSVTSDGLQIVFHSYRPGGTGGGDLWLAARATTDVAFGGPVALESLNSSASDDCPWITSDGLSVIYASNRAGSATFYLSTRTSAQVPFSAPTALPPLASSGLDHEAPYLTDDRSLLYFTVGGDIHRAELQADGSYGNAVALSEINSQAHDLVGSLSADRLEIIFCSRREGGLGNYDLWIARRDQADEPFGSPENLAALNTEYDDVYGALTQDGSTLYYNPDADMWGSRNADVWVTRRDCLAR